MFFRGTKISGFDWLYLHAGHGPVSHDISRRCTLVEQSCLRAFNSWLMPTSMNERMYLVTLYILTSQISVCFFTGVLFSVVCLL